jgi:hypothetical protein
VFSVVKSCFAETNAPAGRPFCAGPWLGTATALLIECPARWQTVARRIMMATKAFIPGAIAPRQDLEGHNHG